MSVTRSRPPYHTQRRGLTPRECEIMDLWDSGQSKQKIARQLAIPLVKVDKCVDYYGSTDSQHSTRAKARIGSEQLAAAINQYLQRQFKGIAA